MSTGILSCTCHLGHHMTCPEEDILLYARGFYGRFGAKAYSKAIERAEELGSLNDAEGVGVWRRVANQIQHLATADGLFLTGHEDEESLSEMRQHSIKI